MDVTAGKTQALRWEDGQSSGSGSGSELEPEAGVPCRPSDEFDATQATPAGNNAAPRRWAARACDSCLRCGRLGHWARDCTEIVCGNCNQLGHCATDCPKAAPCFRCGRLGHWVKDCPQVGPCYFCGQLGHWGRDCPESRTDAAASASIAEPPTNAETRWVIFEPPSLKDYRYHCSVCAYTQMQVCVSKPKTSMPVHKPRPKPATGLQRCEGSNKAPLRAEVVKDRGPASEFRWHVNHLGKHDHILSD